MATNESRKYIWKQFNALRRSTTTADPALKKFHFISSSLKDDDDDDDTEQSSSSSNGAAAASNTPEECAKIIGLIYPLTEPFKQRALRVEIRVPNGYPMQPPEVYMRTTIRHPNIEKDGKICSASLEKRMAWKQLPLVAVVEVVIKLIDEPEENLFVNAEMASLYSTNRAQYNAEMTRMVNLHGEARL